jgi:hypothetical protein
MLEILTQAPTAVEPGDTPLHKPTSHQDDKALVIQRMQILQLRTPHIARMCRRKSCTQPRACTCIKHWHDPFEIALILEPWSMCLEEQRDFGPYEWYAAAHVTKLADVASNLFMATILPQLADVVFDQNIEHGRISAELIRRLSARTTLPCPDLVIWRA